LIAHELFQRVSECYMERIDNIEGITVVDSFNYLYFWNYYDKNFKFFTISNLKCFLELNLNLNLIFRFSKCKMKSLM